MDRDLSEFAKHGKGLQSKCKPCNRIYQRSHYLANKPDYIAKAAVWMAVRRDRNALRILEYFSRHPCVDCREGDPIVLQFDHVRGEKVREVSEMLRNGTPWEKIETEIAKCDVRCANCHWRRHAKAIGWRKLALIATLARERDQFDDAILGPSTIGQQAAPSSSG